MKKGSVIILTFAIFLSATVAGFFVFPNHVNPYLPQSVQVPDIPYHLGLDLQGGIHLVYQADLTNVDAADYDTAMQGLRDVIERRVNFFGVSEPLVQTEGRGDERRLIVELAGAIDSAEAIRQIGEAPFLEFKEPKENYADIVARNQQIIEDSEGVLNESTLEDPFMQTGLNGSLLDRAEVAFSSVTQEPIINLTFNGEGSKLFQEITKRNIGNVVAIYLDDQLIQAPVVQAEIIGGRAQITGGYTLTEAQGLVRDLNAGAVPVSIELLSQHQVGPTLGSISLQKSLHAAFIGLALVVVFMAIVYRIPGVLASIALLVYGLFLLFLFKILGFTFTLAGIAGIILSVGMAVDANILIFSRFMEELKEGKSFAAAVEEGFRRAWPSIRDGNITTLLVALILFWFGSSFVQGFALSLSIGILLSMFTVMVITKSFLRLAVHTQLEKILWLWK